MSRDLPRPLERLIRPWRPRTPRESSDSVVQSFLLHPLPARMTKSAFSWRATGWLGTVSLGLLLVLTGTGGVLMFFYVPSVERAYASIEDLEAVVPFGRWIRATHRAAAHLMVVSVVLHLIRVFLTGAYKKEGAPGSSRPLNWFVGLGLLGTTLGLSFTGYLLPWDQLAFWAVTVGTRIAGSVPGVGEDLRRLMVGGAVVGEPTLVRFYALHVFVLPAITALLVSYHLWRIRKDGGLAVSDRVVDQVRAKAVAGPPAPGKSYSILGATRGGTVSSISPAALLDAESVTAVPHGVRRTGTVLLGTLAASSLLGLFVHAPLEQAANAAVTPNPAKAPWYFLWLQELVSDLTFKIGSFQVDGAFFGGVVLPGLLFGLLAAWPFIDRSPKEAAGVWMHPSRRRQIIVFLAILAGIVVLGVIGTFFRGPYWHLVSPGNAGSTAPSGV